MPAVDSNPLPLVAVEDKIHTGRSRQDQTVEPGEPTSTLPLRRTHSASKHTNARRVTAARQVDDLVR